MINNIMDIIRLLNGGNVIPSQEDEKTKIDLYSDDVELYIDYAGAERKYYYFAEFEMDDEKKDNLAQIEDVLFKNEAYAIIGEPNPSDSYMILFWKIENIEDNIYPYIIKIEENEFFYKKYVFYYTEKEIKSFMKWYRELAKNGISTLTGILNSLHLLKDELDYVKFLTRLLIKVPFLNPVFPKAVMNDFDKIVQKKIDGIRQKQKEKVEIVNDIFLKAMDAGNSDVEQLSDVIYQKLMEE